MSYHGDIPLGQTIDILFPTRRFSTGAPFTLAGTPAVAAYVGNSTTEITAGITLTVDFDSRTGTNNVRVVASSGNGFAAATDVALVITAGTVDSVSVVGEVVGSFSIENRSSLRPTTAGRTLDVSAGGEAGVDWANVGSPSTTVGLSGTTVKTATDVETDTSDIQSRLPAALVSGRIDSSVGAMASGVVTATAIAADAIGASELAADAITEIQSGLATAAALTTVDTVVDAIQAKTDLLPASPAATGDIPTVAQILTTQMTESYAANGVAPTLAQAMFAVQQMLTMFGISGTSLTVKKLDGATTAFVVTLDNATNPTAATRA